MGLHVKRDYAWPGGIVPYVLDGSLGDYQPHVINVMRDWERYVNVGGTYIEFVGHTTQPYHVRITLDAGGRTDAGGLGCLSNMTNKIGNLIFKIGKGGQYVKMGLEDWRPYDEVFHNQKDAVTRGGMKDVPHEFGHVLGLVHEQNRDEGQRSPVGLVPDPNDLFNQAGRQVKKSVTRGDERSGLYDPTSIMHYPDPAGWKWKGQKPTSSTTGAPGCLNLPDATAVTSSNWRPSAGDIAAVRALYFDDMLARTAEETAAKVKKTAEETAARVGREADETAKMVKDTARSVG